MAMMNSRSLEFVEEMVECFSESSLLGELNLTSTSVLVPSTCNGTMIEKIEAYMKPLLEVDFVLAVIYCCIVGVALSVGTVGNILILIVTTGTRTMNRVGRDFVINLALADLCVAAVADPMCILGVVKGEKWFQSRWVLCEVVASMCLSACFCAFLSLTVMSVNRYVFVCRNVWYHKIFRRPVCITLCLMCWISAFMFEFPNFVGWGGHYFDKKNHQCIWDRTQSFSYTLFVSAGLIGGPLLLMGMCFILVFRKIWLTKKDVFSLDKDDPMRMKRVWTEALRSSRTLVVIFIAFVVCWTPYAIITALDVMDNFSTEVHLFVTMLAHLHSSLNFTIYMCTNNEWAGKRVIFFISTFLSSFVLERGVTPTQSISNHLFHVFKIAPTIFFQSFRQAVFALICCGLKPFKSFTYRSSTDTDKTTESYTRSDKSVSELSKAYYINTKLQFEKARQKGFKDMSYPAKHEEAGDFVDGLDQRRFSGENGDGPERY